MKHAVVILAAGKGTRMKSKLPKVLHPLLGKPMLAYCVEAALGSGARKVVVVIGHGGEQVQKALSDYPVEWAVQEEQLGSAHALAQAAPILKDFDGPILVTQGDTPLTRSESLANLVQTLGRAGMILMTMRLDNPYGYGRILRGSDGNVRGIVEEKDATKEEKRIREVNAGIYAFDSGVWDAINEIDNRNAAKEYYLPDLVRVYLKRKQTVLAYEAEDPLEFLGVNTRVQLSEVEVALTQRIRLYWMEKGVRMIRSPSIYIEPSVELAEDVTLWPGVILMGNTKIGSGSEIGAYSVLSDTVVEAGVKIKSHVVAEGAYLAARADAGPFARLRPKAYLEEGAHVGNFVELKNARLGKGAKAGHLAYLGDAEVGEESNIGAGVITANYDGKRKHKTIIGKRVFVGSNSLLIAPVTLQDGAFIAGGSAINQDVPEDSMGIARERQRNIEGYMKRKRESD